MKRGIQKIRGLTLLEIITTVAIIGMLAAILIPSLAAVQKTAANVRQRAQFHGIEMGLEAFRNDTGDYPSSNWDTTNGITSTTHLTASQRLAEVMVGLDGFGFHRNSVHRKDGTLNGTPATALYAPAAVVDASARRGPYLELESANAVLPSRIYDENFPYNDIADSFVLVDIYKNVRHRGTGKRIGMPILYYKADQSKTGHSDAPADAANNIYRFMDSYDIVNLGIPFGGGAHTGFTRTWFYDATLNPNFVNPRRPYRASSFILHSAGPDGLYGTADDVFNFDSE